MSDVDSFLDDNNERAKTPSIEDEYEDDFEQDPDAASPVIKKAENKKYYEKRENSNH